MCELIKLWPWTATGKAVMIIVLPQLAELRVKGAYIGLHMIG